MKPARILIADEHKNFRKVVKEYLLGRPNVLVVGEAEDGIDAIEKTGTWDPDIVLLDISMPGCTGLEATRIIKEQWPLKKVVLATIHDNPFYRVEAQRAGADGYILKSSLKSSLQAAIDSFALSLGIAAGLVVDTHQKKSGFEENLSITDQVLQENEE
jgi:DNA-binding NarL/FixJ family response regulator